jgi:two-component system, cell cycle response regulator CtrA
MQCGDGKTQSWPKTAIQSPSRIEERAVRVLLVEDDRLAAVGTTLVLQASGAAVDAAETGEEALELLHHYEYDIVVLDVMLPDMQGYDVLRAMRARRITIPVLVLSGIGGAQPRIKALGLGADDFISKPVDGQELVARLHAIVRRAHGFSQQTLRLGELELNQDTRDVAVAGRKVELSSKEYGTLELLLLRQGKAVRKEAFLGHLYGGPNEPGVRIIDVFVCHLRKKLADAGMGDLIGTVTGFGYMIRTPRDEPPTQPDANHEHARALSAIATAA